jgi:anti-anti-sigma factor
MATLQINLNRAGRALVIGAAGDLDFGTRDWLADFVEGALDGAARVVIDLHEVRLCDASSMTMLIRIAARCAQRGGWLRLAAPTELVARAFSIVDLGQAVPIYATVRGAVAGDESERIKD